ncbi:MULTISPECIES: hypothetical protein [unclassified Myroides]|uniref:hypothetical protein n=1 Tax=unclassified Myroides TaxID=2642485 RepID=UPI0015FE0DA5|nr:MULTISPECIES: hypothetical protein [unclassified Myroides]MBB1149697.1 hypothetical protein [Myroides sp. NP-2]MDM1408679.1 hypothetical protein [Myroides sp. DF42-4-2]
MKRKKRILLVATLALTSTVFAQGNVRTINNQFSSLFNKSSNYQNYKIVDKQSLLDLQQNVEDSISNYKGKIAEGQSLVLQHQKELADVSQKLETAEQELKTSLAKEENFEFLGIAANKNTFQTVILLLFALLLAMAGVFYYRFKKSNVDTKDALNKLRDTDEEFEEFRKLSLEREQKIRRQLQDEINKNKAE